MKPTIPILRLDAKRLQKAKEMILNHVSVLPTTAIILGSGLGSLADELKDAQTLPTTEIPGYPKSTVAGHAGRLVFGNLGRKKVLAVQGRVHAYEGYPIATVGFPVHLLAELGVRKLIVTNAAGGINSIFSPGDLMLIDDHINMMFTNPLRGQHQKGWGDQWPDMSAPYDPALQQTAMKLARKSKIPLQHGVLLAAQGPTYETASEIRMARLLGADAVTMSTIPEVTVAISRRMKVLGISCITNLATGIAQQKLDHAEVTTTAKRIQNQFKTLLKEIIRYM